MLSLINSSNLTHYYRHPGLTKSTEENILRKLQQKVDSEICAVDSELCYNLDLICDFSKDEEEVWILHLLLVNYHVDYEVYAQREL